MSRRELARRIAAAYGKSAGEYEVEEGSGDVRGNTFKCTRCRSVVPWDFGSADGVCDGLCDDCWVAVRPIIRIAGLDR